MKPATQSAAPRAWKNTLSARIKSSKGCLLMASSRYDGYNGQTAWRRGTPTAVSYSLLQGKRVMGERKSELKRRRHRREKILKLKSRLHTVKEARDREQIIKKILLINPHWQEPAKA